MTALTLLLAVFFNQQLDVDPLAAYRNAALEKWEKEIQKLEQLDLKESDPDKAILFIGSSSIRRWESMATDLQPWPTIRRGYGGAKFSDLAVFVDRLVNPHQFQALVIFVGNDITGSDADKTPDEVLRLFQYVVGRVRIEHTSQPIFLIGVTPNSKRFHAWNRVQEMHTLVKKYIAQDDSLHFIETASSFLGSDGRPRDELFVEDKLHLNSQGYELWAAIIKSELAKVLTDAGT